MSNLAVLETTSAPTNGTTAVFTLTVGGGASTGTYRLIANGHVTTALAWNANAVAIQAALQALPTIGAGNALVTGTGPWTITMAGLHVKYAFGPISVANNSTNGTVVVAETTPGVTATYRTSVPSRELINTTTGDRYRNRSTTVNAPDWRRIRTISHINLYIPLADITAATLYTYTPGFPFKILKHDATVETVSSASSKLATLTWKIAGTATTGGAVALTTANTVAKGAVVAGSAVTAANVGSATDALTLVGSAVTAFIEGAIWDVLQIEIDEAP